METKPSYSLDDFDFSLPEEQIAQSPLGQRDNSRLMCVDRNGDNILHDKFYNITDYLQEGDLLVFNNAKVIHARLFFTRVSGALVEVVLARMKDASNWMVITNKTRRLKEGEVLASVVDQDYSITIGKRDGEYLAVTSSHPFTDDVLKKIGNVPLPPYIKRKPTEEDMERYQTVYAQKGGAVAAPTAGLHFTDEIIAKLEQKGISQEYVTLYVSWGTFSPVRSEAIDDHVMHTESYDLSEEVAARINKARNEGRRIISVGTTSLRVIESTFNGEHNVAGCGETNIFIYPPRPVKSVDGLITNFHTPKSTLLMLVCAFGGYERMMHAYRVAVEKKYRFFSYGDSMLIV